MEQIILLMQSIHMLAQDLVDHKLHFQYLSKTNLEERLWLLFNLPQIVNA